MFAIIMKSMRHRGKQLERRKEKKLVKIEKKKAELICCRTCLSTQDLHPIFNERGCSEKRTEELRLVTGLEIENNDGLPQWLCSKCLYYIIDALKFRITSVKASQTLSRMGYRKVSTQIVINHTSTTKNPVKVSENDLNRASTYSNENVAFPNTYDDNFQENSETYESNKSHHSSSTKNSVKVSENDLNSAATYSNENVIENFAFNDNFQQNSETYDSNKCESIKAKNVQVLYKCNMCSKEFKSKSTCRAHYMKFHTEYRYVCEFCGKKWLNNFLLLQHKRARHGMERIHKCAYCEYSSAQKQRLITHERIHTGEKPYICDQCGASFHSRSTIIQHVAIHLPEKNFQCEKCPSRFYSKKLLQGHCFRTHRPRRYSYACHVCRALYTTNSKARRHMARVHGIAREDQGPLTKIPNIQSNTLGVLNDTNGKSCVS